MNTALATVPANSNAVGPVATGKTVTVWEIKGKDSKRGGRVYPGTVSKGHHAEIIPGKRVRLFGVVAAGARYVPGPNGRQVPCEEHLYRIDFVIGAQAVVGSFNLVYTGTIRSITEKTITVVEYEGTSNERSHRLSLADFDRKNWDFDAAAISKRNEEWMD